MLLLIDLRVPKSLRKAIKAKLTQLRFREVPGLLSDATLTLRVQKMMDMKYNVFIFADRGTHRQARTAFLGYFRSLLYSLIPLPRVVALDALLDLRFENWHNPNAADFEKLFETDIFGSTKAALMLGRLRRTALMFKQCLLLENRQQEVDEGCSTFLPDWIRDLFKDDLDSYMAEIEEDGTEEDTVFTRGSAIENAGMILAATIAAILGWWRAPLLEWRERQIQDGCNAFLEHVVDAPQMCEMLWLKTFPDVRESCKGYVSV
jgi:hypothetical protein